MPLRIIRVSDLAVVQVWVPNDHLNGRETNGARQPAPGHLAPDIWRFGHLAPGQLAVWTIGTQDISLLDIWL